MARQKPDGQLASVVLSELYGYYTDAGELLQWYEGQEVTDAAQVADLIQRGAPLKDAP